MANNKIKFDQEAAFKSIIGMRDGDTKSSPDTVSSLNTSAEGNTSNSTGRERKKRVTLVLLPSDYQNLQKIAFVKRKSASVIISELIADYVKNNQEFLEEYKTLQEE